MNIFGYFYLDREKDILVKLYKNKDTLSYVLTTPNLKSGNIIKNLAKICDLNLYKDDNDIYYLKDEIPCFTTLSNQKVYVLRLGGIKVANIYPNKEIYVKVEIPAIAKTLMAQTKNYDIPVKKTLVKAYVRSELKFTTDLHTHMNGNLSPDILIALGIKHQIKYPLYYIKKLNLKLTKAQNKALQKDRKVSEKIILAKNLGLNQKKTDRKIDDITYINFADLILNNIKASTYNITQIRNSLCIFKDGQAVFTNLEKLYLYRYVFTKAQESNKKIEIKNYINLEDKDIVAYLGQMINDYSNLDYKDNTLYKDELLWIARYYQAQGVNYVEISDTSFVKNDPSTFNKLKEIHEILPIVEKDTGVSIRFLAALRRIALTIIKDNITPSDYLKENIAVLKVLSQDPYIVGSDIVGEEINDIRELEPLIKELVGIANNTPNFTIRIHAGENDSLTDNVYHAINIVKKYALKKVPRIRVGHGVYTANLKTKKGQELIKLIKDNDVVLEFQVTSNVRLNNLNSLKSHPIKKYLENNINCVQGSDGAGLYGTSSIDEQLILENLLDLSYENIKKMHETELKLVKDSQAGFKKKLKKQNDNYLDYYQASINETLNKTNEIILKQDNKYEDINSLNELIKDFPVNKTPIVLAGGSFNSNNRKTITQKKYLRLIDSLLESLDPNKFFFVIGHEISGYEEYLLKNNKKFELFGIVPKMMSKKQINKIKKNKLMIRVSTETEHMATYKSFNYEIFVRRPSVLIVLDGNSAGSNLIQEAKNGKKKHNGATSLIFVNPKTASLKEKTNSLAGYVNIIKDTDEVINLINQTHFNKYVIK